MRTRQAFGPRRGEWIAKADADDISVPGRFEAQLAELARSGADLCGSAMLEFDGDPTNAVRASGGATRPRSRSRARCAQTIRSTIPRPCTDALPALDCGGLPRSQADAGLRAVRPNARIGGADDEPQPSRWCFSARVMACIARRSGRGFSHLERQVQHELRTLGRWAMFRASFNFVLRMTYRRLPAPGARWVHGHLLSRPVATGGERREDHDLDGPAAGPGRVGMQSRGETEACDGRPYGGP